MTRMEWINMLTNYLNFMLDQIKPNKVAYVLGFLISFFPTVTRMSKTFLFLFILGSASSSLFDCTSRAVSVSPFNRQFKKIEIRPFSFL